MLVVLSAAGILLAAMLLFPDTDTGRSLHRWLVEAPARRLDRIARGEAAFYGLLALLGLVLMLVLDVEGLKLFGLMAPEALLWFAMFDVGVFVEALLITGAILGTNVVRTLKAQDHTLRTRAKTVVRRAARRASRAIRGISRPQAGDDNDDRPAWAGQAGYRAFSMA